MEPNLTKDQIKLLKITFPDKDSQKFLRKVFLKPELTVEETEQMKRLQTDEVITALKVVFFPEYSFDGALGNNKDYFLDLEPMGIPDDYLKTVLKAKVKSAEAFKSAFKRLKGESFGSFVTTEVITSEDPQTNAVNFHARNRHIGAVEQGISYISLVAGTPDEEEQEKKKAEALKKNSAK